jgi:hypothetical protein
VARQRGTRLFAIGPYLVLARALMRTAAPDRRGEIDAALTSAFQLVQETGARGYLPSTRSGRNWRASVATRPPARASYARRTGSSPRWAPRGTRSGWHGTWDRASSPPREFPARAGLDRRRAWAVNGSSSEFFARTEVFSEKSSRQNRYAAGHGGGWRHGVVGTPGFTVCPEHSELPSPGRNVGT